jgi:MscS family membrane protein
VLLLVLATSVLAVDNPLTSRANPRIQISASAEQAADDPLGRSTPQGAVLGFMRAMSSEDYERAIEYLDTRQSPKKAEQLAAELQFVIDSALSVDLNRLSRSAQGDLADGLAANRERVGVVKAGDLSLDVQLERVNRGQDPAVWLFSAETLKRVPHVYEQLDVPYLYRFLPTPLAETRILHVPVRRWLSWLSLIVVLPLLFLLARLVSRLLMPLLRIGVRRLSNGGEQASMERVKAPFNLFVLALAFYGFAPFSHSALSRLFWNRMAVTITVVSLTWLALRVIDVVVGRTVRSRRMTAASGRIAITRLGGQFCKGLAMVAGAAVILYDMGINLTAVLTGLGVGGIAIAFAAQKTLENLFGGIMIASDQPVRVGDFCRAGEYSGVVENIGLRSTRIRTMDRTLVSVPNGQLSVMSLENFAMRDKIRFSHTVGLRPETTCGQLRDILNDADRMLREHAKVEEKSSRVRLVGIRNSAFEIELFAYVLGQSWEDFLEIQEDMLLRLIVIVESRGTGFASPAQAPQAQQTVNRGK